jgi:deoxyribonuclease IV
VSPNSAAASLPATRPTRAGATRSWLASRTMDIGAHVPAAAPLAEAAARNADLVQIFLSAPQTWKAPTPREDADELRAAALPIYVHAPYIINVATTNNRVRHPSRKTLQQACDAAGAIGAAGVIVHGGHLPVGDDIEAGYANWRKALGSLHTDVPVLIEDTAGGDNAVARHVDRIARLWEVLDGVDAPVGFCLDTCHLHAAGEDLVAGTERLLAELGRIDLVHLNDSRDPAGSGRDRHANLGDGRIDPEALVTVVTSAGAPVVVETPGDAAAQAADITWIRDRL